MKQCHQKVLLELGNLVRTSREAVLRLTDYLIFEHHDYSDQAYSELDYLKDAFTDLHHVSSSLQEHFVELQEILKNEEVKP